MNIPPDICLLVMDHGIGDHYIVAGFAAAIRKKYGLRVWVAGRKDLSFVGALFPAAERYLEWPKNIKAESVGGTWIRGGSIFYTHFPQLELMRAVGYGKFHFLDAYRCRLGLPADANLSAPKLPEPDAVSRCAAQLTENGFNPGRTVVMNIDARTTLTTGVEVSFWQGLGNRLRDQGLEPLVNAGPTTRVPEGLRALSFKLADFRAMTLAAGAICTVRSGASDLTCDLPCPRVVVYPDVNYWAGPMLQGTGFSQFNLPDAPLEHIVTPETAEAKSREIATQLAGRVAIAA
ncbi:MAG TPA: hypothetical protein VFT72_18230 [Opitutaceae bacterium]|nr:hypothetical protein [Opitutaceae bacterium]